MRHLVLNPYKFAALTTAPTVVGVSATAKNINAHNATLPAGSVGDLILIFSSAYSAETGTPSGYTLLATNDANSGNLRNKIFGRIATGTDTAAFPSIAWQQIITIRLSGASISNVNVASFGEANPSPSRVNMPTVSATNNNYVAIAMAAALQTGTASFQFTAGSTGYTTANGWTSGQAIEPIASLGYRTISPTSSESPSAQTANQTIGTANAFSVLVGA